MNIECQCFNSLADVHHKIRLGCCREEILDVPSIDLRHARLELLSWMVARGHLDVKGAGREDAEGATVGHKIEQQVREVERRSFDIDAVTESDLAIPAPAPSSIIMEDLDRVIWSPATRPPGIDVQPLGPRQYGLLAPSMIERLRVTIDPEYFEEHAESLELWSPGNPLFTPPEFITGADEPPTDKTLEDILDG